MKTNKLLAAMLLMGGVFTMNGQNVASTTTLTSGGSTAGTTGTQSAYYGYNAGKVSTAASCTFIGSEAGEANTTGYSNTYIGAKTGESNSTGHSNTCVGYLAGRSSSSASANVFIGANTGSNNTGNSNIMIGAGLTGGSGTANIFIGAAVNSALSNRLIIDNAATTNPLIYGDFALDQLRLHGQVAIGSTTSFPLTAGSVDVSAYKLFINGGMLAKEVRVATTWADYVFEDDYALPTLSEVECFIDENGHLPNVPSAKQVAEEGISVGEMAKIQQEKIEELTLYIIEQDKQIKQLKDEQLKNEAQQKEINELKALVQSLIDNK